MEKLWKFYSKEQIIQFIKQSTSCKQVGIKMGYSGKGGSNTTAAKQAISYHNLEQYTTHFKIPFNGDSKFRYCSQDQLNNGKSHSKKTYKQVLIRSRGDSCQNCGISQWMGQKISLQLHHKDGNHYNNELSNLILLCPNCHSLTENYAGKNKAKRVTDQEFIYALQTSQTVSKACQKLQIAKTGTNYDRAKKLRQKFNIQMNSL